MATGVDGERPGIGRGERIGAMAILQGALARVRAQPAGLAIWWILSSVAIVGVEQGARAAGVDLPSRQPGEGDAYYRIVRAVVEGVTSAAGLRLILQGRVWLDRGFMFSAAMLTGLGLATGFGVASPYVSGLSGAAQGALVLMLFYLSLKLTLWTIAPLTGRGDLTLPRAWSAMHGATLGLALASLLTMFPLMGLGALYLLAASGATGGVAEIVFDAVVIQAFTAFALAMSATVYALRVEAAATVAGVFD